MRTASGQRYETSAAVRTGGTICKNFDRERRSAGEARRSVLAIEICDTELDVL